MTKYLSTRTSNGKVTDNNHVILDVYLCILALQAIVMTIWPIELSWGEQ